MQRVPLLERQIERTAEQLHHLAARLRPPGFQKTQMFGGDICINRQFDLGQAAHISPVLQQAAECPFATSCEFWFGALMVRQSRPSRRKGNYLGCK